MSNEPAWMTQAGAMRICRDCGESKWTTIYWLRDADGNPDMTSPVLCWDCCAKRDAQRDAKEGE